MLDGELDLDNRYRATVKVNDCAGVLIDARRVLTAAHCVCTQGKADSASCAEAVAVTAVAYLPLLPGEAASMLKEVHQGTVHPHPDFKALFNAEGALESSHADLALVVLNQPIKHNFPPIGLTDVQVKPDELLSLAGYSSDERRFSMHRVVELPHGGSDLIVLESSSYRAGDGGPCLREAQGAQAVVGISINGSSCTSTLLYQPWLNTFQPLPDSPK